jgi:ArsR family transcriptional regulator
MRTLSNVFKALSDETRLQMLGLLFRSGELCVCDFIEVLGISQSKASRHLRYLVNAGLVVDRPEAAEVLATLPSMLTTRLSDALAARLAEWQRRKQQDGGACGARPVPKGKRRRGGGLT